MKRLICAMTILACVLAGLSGCSTAGQVTVPAEDELPAESSAVSTEPLTKTEPSQPGSSGITSTSPETPPTADSPQQEPQVNGGGDAVRDESSKETYASISTVNLGFISQAGGSLNQMLEQNDIRVLAALYAPLDGMNEKGLAVSVNMIQDNASINQNTDKPDLTTTTAVRLLLNKAASVDEALDLLRQYDLHASMGMMIHFALADTTGKGVVVEYINNEMAVTETPVVTNFYLAEAAKHGIGTQQSHERYNILTQTLADHPTMTMEDVRDVMDSVSKDDFNEFESTEWSVVFDLNTGTAYYYHRENYENL